MDPVGDRFMELAKIQQEAYQSASLQSELFTLQKMVMHLQGEINRVQEKIDATPVGKIIIPTIWQQHAQIIPRPY